MAKNKSKTQKVNEEAKGSEEIVEQDEVTYEEEIGGDDPGKGGEEQSFLQKYRNFIIIGVVAAVGLGLFFYVQRNNAASEGQEALEEMAMAEVFYSQDSVAKAINENIQFLGFQTVIDQYDGTDAANMARYYAGTGKLKLGEIDAGISYLEEFKKGDNMISGAAYAALGYAYEQKNDFVSAAENYEKASSTPEENSFSTPMYLMDAARNYESANNNEKALEVYMKIKETYQLYQFVRDGTVDKYIYKLGGETDV